MSWSINIIGKTADVNAAVQTDSCLPQCLKDVVAAFAAAGTGPDGYSPPPGAIHVISSGHYDANSGGSNIYSFSINPITLAPPAPVELTTDTVPTPDTASAPCLPSDQEAKVTVLITESLPTGSDAAPAQTDVVPSSPS